MTRESALGTRWPEKAAIPCQFYSPVMSSRGASRQTHSCALAYQHKDKEPAAGKGAAEDRSCHEVICGAVRHAEEGQHCHPHTTPTRHLRACRGLLHALHAHGTRAQCTHRGTTDGRRDQRQGWSFPAPTAGLPRWTRGLGTPGSAGEHPPRHQFLSRGHPRRQIARDRRTRMKTRVTTADDTVWPMRHLHTTGRGTWRYVRCAA